MAAPRTPGITNVVSERIIHEALRRFRLQQIPASSIIGLTGGSSSAGGGSTVGAAFVPTLIPEGSTFTVPANQQALFALTIDVQGDLVVDGDLVGVD